MNKQSIFLSAVDICLWISGLLDKRGFGEGLLGKQDEDFVVVSRGATGVPDEAALAEKKAELHENYTDIFLVYVGEEDLYIGGEITDAVSTGPGEWRGLNLVGAEKRHVKAGDVVIIPKGVAHKHGIGNMKMIVVKVG
jgi:beta-galactosidase beta subunit